MKTNYAQMFRGAMAVLLVLLVLAVPVSGETLLTRLTRSVGAVTKAAA